MSNFNKKAIIQIQRKLQERTLRPETEEATKQWLVMPMLVALGYDQYSSDIEPEYTLDVGTKKGEKVDYALKINNQTVALIECKQLNVTLSDKYISQLYRYFTISDAHIAILTNGDDYWFFTDSEKENVMDLKPYCSIRLSEASTDEIDKFALYSKEYLPDMDMSTLVQYEKFQKECSELAHALKTNNIPSWLLDALIKKAKLFDVEKPTLARYLHDAIVEEFNGFKADKKENKANNKEEPIGAKMKATMEENKKNASQIKLNHEYIYNDYSDGDWRFHKMDYAIIFGKKIENASGTKALVELTSELFKRGKIKRDEILNNDDFGIDTMCKISTTDNIPAAKLIDGYDIYIGTKLSIGDIVKFMEKLLRYAGVADEEVKFSFRE